MKLPSLAMALSLHAGIGHALPRFVHQPSNDTLLTEVRANDLKWDQGFSLTTDSNTASRGSRLVTRSGGKSNGGHCGGRFAFTCIVINNATPYNLRRGYIHEYQIGNWKDWPETLEPGQTYCVAPRYKGRGIGPSKKDTAAEVVYHLEGTKKPASFRLEFRAGNKHHTWVKFLEGLETENLRRGSEIDLGAREDPDGSLFVLAGHEGGFVTNDGPAAWMQSMMEDIGDLPLRAVVLGRSHHAGSYINYLKGSFASKGNTQAQTEDVYTQLRDGGVRVLDVRIMRAFDDDGEWAFAEAHGTNIAGHFIGAIGAPLSTMMDDVNRFNDEHPGELIIFDIHRDGWELDRKWIGSKGRSELFQMMKDGLKHRVSLPAETDDHKQDYTGLPLRHFIGNGTSGVLVRVSEDWANIASQDESDELHFPGPTEGFVTSRTLPYDSRWSDTDDHKHLLKDQHEFLHKHWYEHPGLSRLYDMQWILTTQVPELTNPRISIVSMARKKLWTRAFGDLFATMTTNLYPSWLTVDAIQGSEFKALIMAMNKCFAAKACGDWAKESRLDE